MSRWRIAVVGALVTVPFLVLAVVGSYYLWQSGWGLYVWWPLTAFMAAGYILGWHWQRKQRLLRPVDFNSPLHWTERDKQAWQLVEARAKAAAKLDSDALSEMDTYVRTAKEMAEELARFYFPKAQDPVAGLTIPEMLTVLELASHDLAELVDKYLPGGHLLTIQDWRRARKAADWYQRANMAYWAVSAVLSPVDTGLRFMASQLGLSRPFQMLQQNLLLWFYTAYLHRLGTYLIELNSGRLRVGAQRYRELMQGRQPGGLAPGTAPGKQQASATDAAEQISRVTITLMGQVKVGKSSLVNALLGEQRARTDVLPATSEIARYELQQEGIPTRLVLQDTVGYGHTGPRADQLRTTTDAAQQSDLVLLVLHARNPARQADLALLQGLRTWFEARPDLRMPPVLAVVTHIDLLSPALEWAPPYDWQKPRRTKEQQIEQAVAAVREPLGEYLVGVVPVCAAEGKVYGINEWVLPAMVAHLDEMHAVALLRCLRAEIDTGKARKVFHQLLAVGKEAVKALWQGLPQKG